MSAFRRSSQQSFVNSYMAKNLFSHDSKTINVEVFLNNNAVLVL